MNAKTLILGAALVVAGIAIVKPSLLGMSMGMELGIAVALAVGGSFIPDTSNTTT